MSNKIFKLITEEIIDSLNHNIVPWFNPWEYEYPHQNLFTARQYTGINAFILNAKSIKHDYQYPFWATMHQFNTMGGMVRRGSKATRVLYYKKKKNHWAAFYHRVFNIDQIDGLEFEPIKPKTKPIEEIEKFLTEYYTAMPKVEFLESAVAPKYLIAQDTIVMPPKERFTSLYEYYSAFFHEIAHSTGKASRMGRLEKTSEGDFSVTTLKIRDDLEVNPLLIKEEIICEIVSCLLCSFFGIFPQTKQNQKAYIRTWLNYLKKNDQFIIKAASEANNIFKFIKDNIKFFKEKEECYSREYYTQNLKIFTVKDFLEIENDTDLKQEFKPYELFKKAR